MLPTWLEIFVHSFLFFAPAFFANSVPVFTAGFGRIDRGKNFIDGKPILGSHKTIGGFMGGLLGGGMTGVAIPLFFPEVISQTTGYTYWIGFLMGFGALLGDAVGSFIKRRTSVKSGRPFPIMDQIGFIAMAWLLTLPFVSFPSVWAWIIAYTLLIHLGANSIAFLMGWKEVPW
ncbi:MAG: CDP-2,3-bis-(O-geranylgeranyl)-sn-glycerol synthase [Candidatus Heimdallarchaeota archaeon]|nr:CDP-2,3-bis-(O-geranylgeranyl)-sn-glycerol synthase [Candidatus Heimdallarchaeota archaeon]